MDLGDMHAVTRGNGISIGLGHIGKLLNLFSYYSLAVSQLGPRMSSLAT
jgi:hypothetical protein